MNKLIALIVMFTLTGCNVTRQDALGEYRCTEEQFIRMEGYFALCNTTGYQSTYCFYSAMRNYCELVEGV